ncbi:MAG: hypothetical protein HUU35_07395 [Armatimonadetes bacterium]|nr:hypothetical protein [Armatimonadota bacterium]
MISKRALALALLGTALALPGLAWAAEASGLGKGSEVPTIHIDAFNDNRGEFCVTCEAAKKPAMVAFVSRADAATKNLLVALDASYKQNRKKHLYAGVVILGSGEQAKALRKYVSDKKFAIPTAAVAQQTDEIKKWKLNPKVSSTTFFIVQHKVKANVANLSSKQVASHVKQITG